MFWCRHFCQLTTFVPRFCDFSDPPGNCIAKNSKSSYFSYFNPWTPKSFANTSVSWEYVFSDLLHWCLEQFNDLLELFPVKQEQKWHHGLWHIKTITKSAYCHLKDTWKSSLVPLLYCSGLFWASIKQKTDAGLLVKSKEAEHKTSSASKDWF